jgi:hypothetical protein
MNHKFAMAATIAAFTILLCLLTKSHYSPKNKESSEKIQHPGTETSVTARNFRPKDHRYLKDETNYPIHKTAESWLADPKCKNLRPEIRIDYFCRQLILASCPSEALKLIEAEKDNLKKGYLIAAVSDEWSKKDPNACYAWATGLKDQNQKECALETCVINASREGNVELAFKFFDDIPSGSTKDSIFSSSISELIKIDRSRVIERLGNISNVDQIRFASKILTLSFIEKNDLAGLRESWEVMPYGKIKDAVGEAAVINLVERDPALGLDWILENMEQGGAGETLDLVAAAFAVKSPERGLSESAAITDPMKRAKFVEILSTTWSVKQPDDAAKFLMENLATSGFDVNVNLLNGVVSGMVQIDHSKTLTMIKNISDPSARNRAETVAIKTLSEIDPKAASLYLDELSLNSRPESGHLFNTVASKWLARDPLAASNWISNLPVGRGRDRAVESLVYNIMSVDKDCQMAGSWAAQIGDSELRASVISKINKNASNKK